MVLYMQNDPHVLSLFWRPIMRMNHLWDREQRINKAWNYSWVQWRDVDWHGPRRGHTQTCSLTHTLLPLPWDVQLMCVWMPSEQLQMLSSPCQVYYHQLLSLLPRDSWHSAVCLYQVSHSPHTHLTPHTLAFSLPKPSPSSHPLLSGWITVSAE